MNEEVYSVFTIEDWFNIPSEGIVEIRRDLDFSRVVYSRENMVEFDGEIIGNGFEIRSIFLPNRVSIFNSNNLKIRNLKFNNIQSILTPEPVEGVQNLDSTLGVLSYKRMEKVEFYNVEFTLGVSYQLFNTPNFNTDISSFFFTAYDAVINSLRMKFELTVEELDILDRYSYVTIPEIFVILRASNTSVYRKQEELYIDANISIYRKENLNGNLFRYPNILFDSGNSLMLNSYYKVDLKFPRGFNEYNLSKIDGNVNVNRGLYFIDCLLEGRLEVDEIDGNLTIGMRKKYCFIRMDVFLNKVNNLLIYTESNNSFYHGVIGGEFDISALGNIGSSIYTSSKLYSRGINYLSHFDLKELSTYIDRNWFLTIKGVMPNDI